jgi:hypothetical protein
MNRKELHDELGLLDGSYTELTREQQRRAQEILKLLRQAKCRNCHKEYDIHKSRAYYTGFCSAKCLHAKAKELGYRQARTDGRSEYNVLCSANCIGNDYVTK